MWTTAYNLLVVTDGEEAATTTSTIPRLAVASPITTGQCIIFEYFIRIGVHGTLVVFGILGNLFNMMVIWEERKKTATFFLIFSLSVVDALILFFLGIISLPSAILKAAGHTRESTIYYFNALTYVSGFVSIVMKMNSLLTVLVTWHRYINVCMPFKVKQYGSLRNAKVQVLVTFVISFIVSIPRFFEFKVEHKSGPGPGVKLQRQAFALNDVYEKLYTISLNYFILFIIPLICLLYMTTALILGLKNAKKRREEMGLSVSNTNDDLNLSLIIVVIIFIIFRLFGPLRSLVLVLHPEPSARMCNGVLFYYEPISQAFSLGNSAINFIIYVLCVERFRKRLKYMCVGSTRSKVIPWYGTNTDQTSKASNSSNV